jgi:hypothetical protein
MSTSPASISSLEISPGAFSRTTLRLMRADLNGAAQRKLRSRDPETRAFAAALLRAVAAIDRRLAGG